MKPYRPSWKRKLFGYESFRMLVLCRVVMPVLGYPEGWCPPAWFKARWFRLVFKNYPA